MKAREYLENIKKLDALIDTKLQEIATLEAKTQKITVAYEGEAVKSSGSQDKMADTIAMIVDLQSEISKDMEKYTTAKSNVLQVMNMMQNPEYIKVLYKRYFEYKTWEEIACELNFSYKWVCVLHGRALNVMDSILEGRE